MFEPGRYEYVGGTSAKFWEVEFDQASGTYTTRWGRIGAAHPQEKKGLSQYEAQAKVLEKLAKGYRLVKSAPTGSAPQPAPTPPKPATKIEPFDFQAAIREFAQKTKT